MPPPSHTGRRLLTVDEPAANVTFLNVSGCLFLYATDIRLSIVSDAKNVSSFSLPPLVDRAYTAGSCGPGSNATTRLVVGRTWPAVVVRAATRPPGQWSGVHGRQLWSGQQRDHQVSGRAYTAGRAATRPPGQWSGVHGWQLWSGQQHDHQVSGRAYTAGSCGPGSNATTRSVVGRTRPAAVVRTVTRPPGQWLGVHGRQLWSGQQRDHQVSGRAYTGGSCGPGSNATTRSVVGRTRVAAVVRAATRPPGQ